MENDHTRLEENPDVLLRNNAKSTGGFDANNVARPDYACVSHALSSFPPRLNAGIHHFFPDQMPTTGIDRMINSSLFNVPPTPNIELDSLGHIRNRIWTSDVNMNHTHVKDLSSRNIVKPHISIDEDNSGNSNVTLDEFLSNQPDQFGSFLTSGGVDNIGNRLENLNEFGRDLVGNSGSTALFQSKLTGLQTASGTSMDCMSHQVLSGLNFASTSTIPSNSYVNSSPLSVIQRTQRGGPEIFLNRIPGNHAAPLGSNQFKLLDLQRNHSKDSSMASLFGSPNTRLNSLQQNQVGSGSYQFQLLDNGKTRGTNLSRGSLLGRHSSQLTNVQHSNGEGSAWNSPLETSFFPCSSSLRVPESSINDDHLGGVESWTGQSSHGVCRPSLKRGAIQPPLLAPRAQRRKQVVQLPSQLSNAADSINTSQPIAESGQFLASSSRITTHKSAVLQMFQQYVPTFAQTVRPYPRRSTHRIKLEVSDEIRPTGKKCYICKRDVSFEPEGGSAVKAKNPPPVAILPCRHVFHDQCLEGITPGGQPHNPPCIPCAVGETPL